MSEWQDISTAPKDGRAVWTWTRGIDDPLAAYMTMHWNDIEGAWISYSEYDLQPHMWMEIITPTGEPK